MRPLRIAFLNASGDIGGAERALLLLLEQLDRRRYAPSVTCFGKGRLVEALSDRGLSTAVIPMGAAEKLSRTKGGRLSDTAAGAASMFQAMARLVAQLRRQAPDLIHTNNIKTHLIGGLAGRVLRRPVVWHMRDVVPEGRQRTLFQRAARVLPHRIVAVSKTVQEQFHGSGAEERVRTVHDAADPERYQPRRPAAEVREALGIAPDTLVLAMVAHYAQWKGHMVFLEALARLALQGMPVKGLLIGGSIYGNRAEQDHESAVRERARELGLGDRAIFTGFQDCVPDFLNAADLLVHPPTRPEPFGLAVIEAMLLGKPVVASAGGGMLETVEPGRTGLLFPTGNVAELARAVRQLALDAELRAAMGAAGRERVHQLFSPHVHYTRVESVYRELLELP